MRAADGCVATGKTREEVEREMAEALEFHLEGMREEGYGYPSLEPIRRMWTCLPDVSAVRTSGHPDRICTWFRALGSANQPNTWGAK